MKNTITIKVYYSEENGVITIDEESMQEEVEQELKELTK